MNNSRTAPKVLLDDATPGRERLLRYVAPRSIVSARTPDEVPAALADIQRAVAGGRHAAGYFSYELGYALEPRLSGLSWGKAPLLWFGIFDAAETIEGGAVATALAEMVRGRAHASPLVHEWSVGDYARKFSEARALIAAGDIYQVNLSFRSRFRFAGEPLALYRSLRESARAGHGAFIDDGERTILSLSPELFFAMTSDRRIVTRPMKGTARRGEGPESDLALRTALAASPKNRAENLMIVDLLRNDLSRIAETGSVAVPSLFAIETYPTLHQMVSSVTAQARPGTSVEAIVRALFPCGSITGAPKIRAMEIIRVLETSPRGAYCGAIGAFSPDGSAKFNVAIRTATLEQGQGELGIGSAVVYDSNAEAEFDECLLKARYFEIARTPLALIETLAFRPGQGFVRLTLHLARMARSAEAFGIPFDARAAERALETEAAGAREARRMRLLLEEGGALSCTSAPLPSSPSRWTYAISPLRVESSDPLARHKTSLRSVIDAEQARLAAVTGADEALFLNEKGEIAEGSRTNVFVVRGGKLVTPPLDCGVLDGCLRRELIDQGKCEERVLTESDLEGAEAVYLGNSLRGLIPAVAVERVRSAV